MATNAPKVDIQVEDKSFTVSEILKGIAFVQGITVRGKINDPSEIITSWAHYLRVFGGYRVDSDFPHLCQRMLEGGSQLRINRLTHYTDITDASTLTADKSLISPIKKITFSAALVASNVYDLTINGTPISSVTYATSNDATLAAIATAIEAVDDYVQDAFVIPVSGGSTNDRVIVIIPRSGVNLSLSASAVTLGASQATTTITSVNGITDSLGNILFNLTMKNHGEDYDNVVVDITNASNGNSGYFDLVVTHLADSNVRVETYQNLIIPNTPGPTANASEYLLKMAQESVLLDIVYSDLSGITTGTIRPVNARYYFSGGDDGLTSLAASDMIGDSGAKTGIYAFDNYDDGMIIATPDSSDNSLHVATAAYAASRQDLVHFAHLSNSSLSASDIYGDRDTTAIDSSFTGFYAGGLKITDPVTSQEKEISELGDVIALSAKTDQEKGEHWAFDGPNRGKIPNALGVVNNFGGNGNYANLNLLANHQVNMVVVKNGVIQLTGNFTGQLATSKLSYMSIRKLVIAITKTLGPTLEMFIGEPNDIPTWKDIYQTVKPYLDGLTSSETRALYDYVWDGDQDKNTIDQITVNDPIDVDMGIYTAFLYIKPINSINYIKVKVVITPTNVSFTTV